MGLQSTTKLLSTWDLKRPCSQWFGVTCDGTTHRVNAIKLTALGGQTPFFKLSGPLPAELGSLPELGSLILARNAFGDVNVPFPSEWARLRKLSHLDLSGNKGLRGDVTAPIPLALCSLTSLTYLNFADRFFEGLPTQFNRLQRLQWVDLSAVIGGGYPLKRSDLQILGSLTRLKSLFLRDSFLNSSDLGSLGRLRGLEQLDLSGNPSLGSFPAFLRNLPQLADLRLSSIVEEGDIGGDKTLSLPAWLGSLQRLTSLELSSNSIGSLPKLGVLSRLARLVLKSNRLGGKVPQELLNSRSLTSLDLSYNNLNLVGITFGPHASSRLRRLDLSTNNVSGTLSKGLSGLTRLESLSHSGNRMTGAIPQFLWTFPSLTRLDLSRNALTGFGFSSQQNRKWLLRSLDLWRNKLQGGIPGGWSALTGLTALSLAYNKLTGTVPGWVGRLKALGTLNLTHNRLTGTITAELGGLKALATLDLSSNQLSGFIPGWLAARNTLVTLNLSSNQLTGSIPDRLGALTVLAKVDLGANKLTGRVPGALFLPGRELSVADNQLAGALPATATRIVMRRMEAAFFGYLLPGREDLSGNYLTGLCYSNLINTFTRCPLDLATCLESGAATLEGLNDNCLIGEKCNETSYGGPIPQRSTAQCSQFCGANKPGGPCNGHGFCSLKGPKKTPTCTCSKGFTAPSSNPGTCVPAPKLITQGSR